MVTTTEFLQLLEGIRDQFNWELTTGTRGESERRATPRHRLKGRPLDDPSLVLGPLQALCYARTCKLFDPEAWPHAAAMLHMERQDAAAVVAAANDHLWAGPEGQRVPNDSLMALRQQLLSTAGLNEPSVKSGD